MFIGDTSVTVSTSISRFILNRAKAAYIERIKTEEFKNKSLEANKSFPLQCTKQMLELLNFESSQYGSRLIGE